MNANERDLVQRFVDDMTDYAIAILDVQGRVLTWNAGARALFGYTSDDIVGRRFTVLHTKADNLLGKPETALGDALQWGRHESTGPMLRKDGARLQARLILRPLSDSWQRHVGYGLLAYIVLPELWTHYEHQRGLANLPMVTRTGQGIPGDPINVGLVGDSWKIRSSRRTADGSPISTRASRASSSISASI